MLSITKTLLWGVLCMMLIMKDVKVTCISTAFHGVIVKAAAIDFVAQFCETFPIFCKVDFEPKSGF